MNEGALADVRVLDVATLFPAPLLAAMLGDLGADVVKIEPLDGDPLRAFGHAPWAIAGRNKRSVQIDFDDADGLALLHRLIAATDVVVANQPGSLLARWACTDEDITTHNPRAIVVHVSAFGASGPYADRVGNGTLAEAFVGLPAASGAALGDTFGAVTGALQVLAALHARNRDGRGRVLDVSLYEALLPLVAPALAGAGPVVSVRHRYVAGDGRSVAVSATTPAQLDRLATVAGNDPGQWIAARRAVEAVDELRTARVPAVIVNDVESLRADPHVVARRSIAAPVRPAPALGEHTAEVVEEWLHGGNA